MRASRRLISATVPIRTEEITSFALSFAYFFLLLCGYYVIRPIRDEMSAFVGPALLPTLLTYTFMTILVAVPLYAWVVKRFSKRHIVPVVYLFFGSHLLLFCAVFSAGYRTVEVAAAYYVWLGVFNLFVVSVFWSYLVDLYSIEQAKRLFGAVAVGGTAGALVGPLLTQLIVGRIGPANLLLVSFAMLLSALACVLGLNRVHRRGPGSADDYKIGETLLSGVRRILSSGYLFTIALWVLLGNTLTVIFYIQQQTYVGAALLDPIERIKLFSQIDLAVNALTLFLQMMVAGPFMRRLGVGLALAVLPMLTIVGFVCLALWPVVAVAVFCQSVGRAVSYALLNPARHALFSVTATDEKYKAHNIVDTVLHRGGDAAGGWLYSSMTRGAALDAVTMAAVALPFAVVWTGMALMLGRMYSHRSTDAGAISGTTAANASQPA